MRYAVKIKYLWSPGIAYSVGLMASDGCLSPDNRHLTLVSNDVEQLHNFLNAINKQVIITPHQSGSHGGNAFRVQFSDTGYFDFLINVGLTCNKSKTIGDLKIPKKYYCHFLRGVFDGDGTTYAYYDPRWKNSYLYYTGFTSASKVFLNYLALQNSKIIGTVGTSIRKSKDCFILVYGKKDSNKLYHAMYKDSDGQHLSRKKIKLEGFIKEEENAIINRNARVLEFGRQFRLRF